MRIVVLSTMKCNYFAISIWKIERKNSVEFNYTMPSRWIYYNSYSVTMKTIYHNGNIVEPYKMLNCSTYIRFQTARLFFLVLFCERENFSTLETIKMKLLGNSVSSLIIFVFAFNQLSNMLLAVFTFIKLFQLFRAMIFFYFLLRFISN